MTPEYNALMESYGTPDALKCVETILEMMKRRSPGANTYGNEPEGDAQKAEGFIRNFGNWVLPPDAEPDEEDYDWETLSQDTKDILEEVFEEAELRLHRSFNHYKIQYWEEEKNWITISVETL